MGERESLLQGQERHIWWVDPTGLGDLDLLSRYAALLTAEEEERRQRFVFEKHRHAFLVTRALIRSTLSRYADVAPEQWRFRANAYGRPEIASPSLPFPLRFNITHTDGLIACLIHLEEDAGLDVEDSRRVKDPMQLADHFFSPAEVAALQALPASEHRRRFFAYWTLKEAYIKARGMGLAIPLHHFSFELETPGQIGISFDPQREDWPGIWQFAQWQISEHHVMAAALVRGERRGFALPIRRVVPLTDDVELCQPALTRGEAFC